MDEEVKQLNKLRNNSRDKKWIKSQQNWTWIITISWMLIANLWPPFGLYGFVCMLTPIIIALSGRGKMSCARICPRGSFIGKFTKAFSGNRVMPSWMHSKRFKFILWAIMMGTFIGLMFWAVPKGVYTLGKTILYFMEAATLIAFITGIIFKPRSWCIICPMGFSAGNIRDIIIKKNR
ncbi:hypothetical protein CSC2_29380 [Clostridium zeae]|uniref:4Fe-4S ferredoxin-type domain-containing protein n=1 Tax=Clostridium zeae TaxID=2759022 RepID=A0ABQ1ECB5_9CLOT|nr:4Fe-4S ferredoxin [Clostridium zeae]GFZ32412.1 hypothetical protein CSC2_29380 [Clostridium zeae]